MRKKDREVTDKLEILDILKRSQRTVLAFNGKEVPYLLPVNTGAYLFGEQIVLYFHGAKEGTKYDYIKEGALVSFEADTDLELVADKSRGYCTMNYSSVIGYGVMEEITDYDEKLHSLQVLVDDYHLDEDFKFSEKAMDRTAVFKILVKEARGKMKK
ncbi:MAG: pyridoxamine 5'-phosphate oxidase family protein [Lagierella massiliensis]|nr:pyridoxamine 5'-phosphate oxidase family protein [Lagierella massiliensis]